MSEILSIVTQTIQALNHIRREQPQLLMLGPSDSSQSSEREQHSSSSRDKSDMIEDEDDQTEETDARGDMMRTLEKLILQREQLQQKLSLIEQKIQDFRVCIEALDESRQEVQ